MSTGKKSIKLSTRVNISESALFLSKLEAYKNEIDVDIAAYSKHIQVITLQQYGAHARLATDAYLDVLNRGGKRIRGALTMVGYEMSGGQNQTMIVQAARAIEMLHAYILIVDDIQDRSDLRRGGPTAHKKLSGYHLSRHLAGDADHFGVSSALNAALAGAHASQMILANIDAPENLRLNALSIINRTMVITAHGQTGDIMHEALGSATLADIENVMLWKTAQYGFLNPLHVGMVLAGADCHATDAITDYATNAGKAYQVTDDIIGIFGSEQASGKSPMDDIREGKQTVLTSFAMEHADKADKNFLLQTLGNKQLTQAELERCKAILLDCGAMNYAQDLANQYIEQAIDLLNMESSRWTPESTQFLHSLAKYILIRTS